VKKPTKKEARAVLARYQANMEVFNATELGFQFYLAQLKGQYETGARKIHCVVCNAEMAARRRSKLTCSDRCRTRFSRLRLRRAAVAEQNKGKGKS